MNSNKGILIAIFSLAFVMRLLFILTMSDQLVWYDEIQYDAIARRMLRGGEYGSTAFAPLQPFFLLGIYSLFGANLFVARLIQALLGSGTSLLIFYIGSRVFNRNIGMIAGVISIFYPYFIYITGVLYPIALFTFLLALLIFLLLRFYNNKRKSYLILSGVVSGLCLLCIPTVIFFIAVIPLWLIISRKFTFKEIASYSLILLGITLIVVAPWSVRNSLHYHRFVLVTTEGGHAFWQGNNPYFDGIRRLGPDEIPIELRSKMKGLSAAERDRVFFQEALSFIKENPWQFIKLYFIKFINYWRPYPKTISQNQYTSMKTTLLGLFSYGVLLPFSFLGIYLSRKQGGEVLLLVLALLSFALGYSFFLTSTRYRIPVDPYIIIFASVGLKAVFKKLHLF